VIDAAIWGRDTAAGVKTRLLPVSSSGYAVAEVQAAAPERRVFWERWGGMRLAAFWRRTWPAAPHRRGRGKRLEADQRHSNLAVQLQGLHSGGPRRMDLNMMVFRCMENVLVEINLARKDAAYARSLLDRFGFRYSVVESGDRVRIVLVGRQAVAFAAGYAAIVDELEGEPLELVYQVGELIVEHFGKYAVLKMPTPGEAREAASHISVIASAEARGRVVKAGGGFLTRLLDVSLNFRQMKRGVIQVVKAFVSQIYDPRRKAVYVPLRLYRQFAELYIPRTAGTQVEVPGGWLQLVIANGVLAGWDVMPPDFMEELEMRRLGTYVAQLGDAEAEVELYALGEYWKVAVVKGVDAATLLDYLDAEDRIPQQDGKLYLSRWATAELLKRGALRKSNAQRPP